jgi:hypothetical protein
MWKSSCKFVIMRWIIFIDSKLINIRKMKIVRLLVSLLILFLWWFIWVLGKMVNFRVFDCLFFLWWCENWLWICDYEMDFLKNVSEWVWLILEFFFEVNVMGINWIVNLIWLWNLATLIWIVFSSTLFDNDNLMGLFMFPLLFLFYFSFNLISLWGEWFCGVFE